MRRNLGSKIRITSWALCVGLAIPACSTQLTTAQQALSDQGCTVNAPDPRACDPADTRKTTICHIPPGNPANAHTICVGNAAVPAHLDHGDFAGTCDCTAGVDAGVDPGLDAGEGSGSGSDGGSGSGSGGGADGGVVL
jgi:hypothetical protein